MTDLTTLIQHPEMLSKETLYDLRSVIALHPYYQPARFLLLKNLYLLHDSSFDDELRRAALYVTDRTVLFQLIEGQHYRVRTESKEQTPTTNSQASTPNSSLQTPNSIQSTPSTRTESLIDTYLDSLPQEEPKSEKRKPTPTDATVDYVAYLLEMEDAAEPDTPSSPTPPSTQASRTSTLIDTFINDENGRMTLQEEPEYEPEEFEVENNENEPSDDFFTETLAQIYIKQGRYSKALEIIKRLNLIYPKKNRYFADQIRFLEKLILNSNK